MASVIHIRDRWVGTFWQRPYIPTILSSGNSNNSNRVIISKGNIIEGIEAIY